MKSFVLLLQNNEGKELKLLWDPLHNKLIDSNTNLPVGFPDDLSKVIKKAHYCKQFEPTWYTNNISLKLGDSCNYSCKYCLQGEHNCISDQTSDRQINKFLTSFEAITKTTDRPWNLLYWGGEPLIYFQTLRTISKGIRKFLPNIELQLITNGSLLNMEIANWIIKSGSSLAISHDGFDNKFRSGDPLAKGTATRQVIDYLYRVIGKNKLSFNPVFSSHGYRPDDVIRWFIDQFDENVRIAEGTPCLPYTNATQDPPYFKSNELPIYSQILSHTLADYPIGSRCLTLLGHARHLLFEIERQMEVTPLGLCAAYTNNYPITDLNDNLLSCFNYSHDYIIPSTGEYNTKGFFSELAKKGKSVIRDVNLPSWIDYDRCHDCPVLPICKGGCPMLDEDGWKAQCSVRYWHYMAIFDYALYLITGCHIVSIEK